MLLRYSATGFLGVVVAIEHQAWRLPLVKITLRNAMLWYPSVLFSFREAAHLYFKVVAGGCGVSSGAFSQFVFSAGF